MIQRIDLKDQVYEALKERLLAGDLAPGAPLTLQGIADEMAVSRSPVQSALTRLCSQRLVDLDSRGYHVRPITATTMDEAHGVRCALELYAAEQTVGKVSPDQLQRFRELSARTAEHVANSEFVDKHEYMLANKAFHEHFVDMAGNEALSDAYRALNLHELMERVIAGPIRAAGNSSEEHAAIVEAYEAGDLAAARAAIIENVETGKRIARTMIEACGGVV